MLKLLIIAVLAVGALADEYETPIQNALEEQCKKHSAEDKVEEAKNATRNFLSCMRAEFDVQLATVEIEEAKPKGTLDEVFKKYCAKTPQVKQCFHDLIDGVSPCLESEARSHAADAKTGVDQLLNFVCYNNGDRIALFIAEGGPECFSSKSDELKQCVQTVQASVPSAEAAKALTITEKCGKYDDLSACIVNALEECDSPTPGNMIDSLLRNIRGQLPCKDITQKF